MLFLSQRPGLSGFTFGAFVSELDASSRNRPFPPQLNDRHRQVPQHRDNDCKTMQKSVATKHTLYVTSELGVKLGGVCSVQTTGKSRGGPFQSASSEENTLW